MSTPLKKSTSANLPFGEPSTHLQLALRRQHMQRGRDIYHRQYHCYYSPSPRVTFYNADCQVAYTNGEGAERPLARTFRAKL
ncbi:hypothetical protein B0H16DRAFT_1731758 [Mycena metata]|uniref:Uncharacterized protein n=1 Tax=Mycena metata TaxID=1033252 RepID=A0AAD7I3K5_9AGAR|nr:hypothetical protein B0H16DRAFT_1731758 [Mycena metata]